ncbi:MAG: hypothetical protein HGA31_02920 [Candidatus Moranbacteria bacterium]|nr:hypothetical protein [Candidatus Moranbacteria bacterium]
MPIKKIFPFLFIIILIFAGFGYVKPTVEAIIAKRANGEVLREDLSAAKRTRQNIDQISGSLDTVLASDAGKAAFAYLPQKSDQERIVDIMNYFSFQSGVSVDEITFEHSTKQPMLMGTDTPVDQVAGVAIAPSAPATPVPESVIMTMGIRGSYESVKSFVEKLSTSGRFHVVENLSIKKEDGQVNPDGTAVKSDLLLASVKAEFFNLSVRSYPGAHLLPVFTQGVFDTAPIDQLLDSEESVPALQDPAASGRSNPFAS